MKKIISLFLILTAFISLNSCISSGGSSDSGDTTNINFSSTGQFQDSYVEGLEYITSSGVSGITDSLGQFKYNYGDRITFKIGNLILGETEAKTLITPTDLTQDPNRVLLIASLLISIDDDGNPSNLIRIDPLKKKDLENISKTDLQVDDINTIKAKLLEKGIDIDAHLTEAQNHIKNTYWDLITNLAATLDGYRVYLMGSVNTECDFYLISQDANLLEVTFNLSNCSNSNNYSNLKFKVGADGLPYYVDNNGNTYLIYSMEPKEGKVCFGYSNCIKKSPNLVSNNTCCNFTGSLSCDEVDRILDRVNAIRAEVGVPPLSWDCDLAEGSLYWAYELAKMGQIVHSSGDYGENIFWSSYYSDVIDAINAWYSEKPNFVYGKSDWCVDGTVCGHYTQLIWKDTKYIGCGIYHSSNGTYTVCRFYPPGNIIGQQPY